MKTWELVLQLPLEERNCQLSIINIYWGLTGVVAGKRECQTHPQKVMLFQVKHRFDCSVFPLVPYFFIPLEIWLYIFKEGLTVYIYIYIVSFYFSLRQKEAATTKIKVFMILLNQDTKTWVKWRGVVVLMKKNKTI